MRKITYLFLALMLCISNTVTLATNFTTGNLVVLRVGDGSATLTSASTATFLDEITPMGVLVRSVANPTSGDNAIANSGTAGSEGALTLSADGKYLTFAGYNIAPGTASVNGTTSTATNRIIISYDKSTNFSTVKSATAFSANNIRSASRNGNNFWAGGTSSGAGTNGVQYFGTGTAVQVSSTVTNIRVVNDFNGQLYFSTGSGTRGIYKVGTGLPTTTGETSTAEIAIGTAESPYGFSFNSNSTVCYIADDRAIASGGGIMKYVKIDGTWTLQYTLKTGMTAGAYGLTVDWTETNPVIYATMGNSAGNKLIKFIDEGENSTAVELATAPTNTAFRGVAFAPKSSVPTSAASASIDTWTLKNRTLYFDAMPSTNIEVYSVTGSKVASFEPAMHVALNLSKGIYIVKVNKAVSKIILK